jgi:NADH oxidase (H2O2-forming)
MQEVQKISLNPGKDFVVIAIGMIPDIDFLDPSDFDRVSDGLVVDEHMKTNAQDVWAAGDCVSFYSGIDRKPLGGKLATNAVPMAKVAARNMMGITAVYPGFFNGAATVVGKYRIGGTGFT